MSKIPTDRTPKYRRQKARPSDRAFVEVDGKRLYLGVYKSPESREKYHRIIAELLATGGGVPASPHFSPRE